jgi:HYDIN/CFA65/VesB family protein
VPLVGLANQSCTISVTFKPTATGLKTATVNINGGGAGTQTVALSGTGVASYTVSPTSVPFGSVPHGTTSAAQSATVTNTSAVALPITSIKFSGTNPGQFSQTNNCGKSVAVGTNCTISVVFKPTVKRSLTATLNVNAGGGAGTQTVALSGTGT